jgi:hypothetical protein
MHRSEQDAERQDEKQRPPVVRRCKGVEVRRDRLAYPSLNGDQEFHAYIQPTVSPVTAR